MRESIYLYEGQSAQNPKDKRDLTVVMPQGRQFVESKTAEEVRAMNTYEYSTYEGKKPTWRSQIMKELSDHVQRRVKLRAKRPEMLRMKNIVGNSILRIGNRKIMRQIKERVESTEDAVGVTWNKVTVPMYDDLFVQIVSPFNFAVDPNAKTMDDAMDCYHNHYENWEDFQEAYRSDPRFKNVDAVMPGAKFKFDETGNLAFDCSVPNDGVEIEEYFCKPLDQWVVVANGVLLTDPDNPLPDDHKELPFISYHNAPQFLVSMAESAGLVQGREVSAMETLFTEEGFWRLGDPLVIKHLIDLNTGFAQALFRNAKLAAEVIVATDEGYRFNENINWRSGDQAEGMKGKFESQPLARTNIGDVMPILDYLFKQMVLTLGNDPQNLADMSGQKTATEAAIIRETAAKRLEEGIIFNEENGEVRLGTILTKDAQQYYSIPEVVRLTGWEDEKALKKFDEVVKSPNTGKPIYGKRLRRIVSAGRYKEMRRGRKDTGYKYYLTEHEEGQNSFLARPEWIRSSDVTIVVSTVRNVAQIKAVQIEQTRQAIELFVQLYGLTVPGMNGEAPALLKEDLPPISDLIQDYLKLLGKDASAFPNTKEEENVDEKGAIDTLTADRPGIGDTRRTTPNQSAIPTSTPPPPNAVQAAQ